MNMLSKYISEREFTVTQVRGVDNSLPTGTIKNKANFQFFTHIHLIDVISFSTDCQKNPLFLHVNVGLFNGIARQKQFLAHFVDGWNTLALLENSSFNIRNKQVNNLPVLWYF